MVNSNKRIFVDNKCQEYSYFAVLVVSPNALSIVKHKPTMFSIPPAGLIVSVFVISKNKNAH